MIASGLSITEERKKIYAYTVPIISNRQAIAVAANSSIQSKHDLGGKTVCMEDGSYAILLVEQYKGKSGETITLIQSSGADACLRELISGNVEAVVLDQLVVHIMHIIIQNYFVYSRITLAKTRQHLVCVWKIRHCCSEWIRLLSVCGKMVP